MIHSITPTKIQTLILHIQQTASPNGALISQTNTMQNSESAERNLHSLTYFPRIKSQNQNTSPSNIPNKRESNINIQYEQNRTLIKTKAQPALNSSTLKSMTQTKHKDTLSEYDYEELNRDGGVARREGAPWLPNEDSQSEADAQEALGSLTHEVVQRAAGQSESDAQEALGPLMHIVQYGADMPERRNTNRQFLDTSTHEYSNHTAQSAHLSHRVPPQVEAQNQAAEERRRIRRDQEMKYLEDCIRAEVRAEIRQIEIGLEEDIRTFERLRDIRDQNKWRMIKEAKECDTFHQTPAADSLHTIMNDIDYTEDQLNRIVQYCPAERPNEAYEMENTPISEDTGAPAANLTPPSIPQQFLDEISAAFDPEGNPPADTEKQRTEKPHLTQNDSEEHIHDDTTDLREQHHTSNTHDPTEDNAISSPDVNGNCTAPISTGTIPKRFAHSTPITQQRRITDNMANCRPHHTSSNDDTKQPAAKRDRPNDEDNNKGEKEKNTPSEQHFDLSALECPVCCKVPRYPPIFGCTNGHILCDSCQSKLQACPMCRDSAIKCRQRFAEQYLEHARTTGRHFPCTNAPACNFKAPFAELQLHEQSCRHTPFPCPGRHRGACYFMASPNVLLRHAIEKKCVLILKPQDGYTYKACLQDSDDVSVFDREQVTTHWRPVLLAAKLHLPLIAYLLIRRDGHSKRPLWTFQIRSIAPPKLRDTAMVRLTIRAPPPTTEELTTAKLAASSPTLAATFNAGEKDKTINPEAAAFPNIAPTEFELYSPLVPYDLEDKDASKNGDYLIMTDDQIKKLSRGSLLFSYQIQIKERTNRHNYPSNPSDTPAKPEPGATLEALEDDDVDMDSPASPPDGSDSPNDPYDSNE